MSDVKTRCKNNAKFIWRRALTQLSFVQFRPYATSFLGILFPLTLDVKTLKDPGEDVWPHTFFQDLCWCQGWGSCFKYGLFGKLVPWFYKKKKTEKDVSFACISSSGLHFSFCKDFLHHWLLLLVKKNKYATLSMHCFFLNLRLNFDLQLMEVSQCLNKPLYI